MCLNSIILGVLGGQEILLILIVVLVLFGGKKIPELMRGLGRGVSEFKKAKNEVFDEVDDLHKDTPPRKNDADPAASKETKS
jgi:sec-independent protein translocase protein TatA